MDNINGAGKLAGIEKKASLPPLRHYEHQKWVQLGARGLPGN